MARAKESGRANVMGSSSKTSKARGQESKNPVSFGTAESSISMRDMLRISKGDDNCHGMPSPILW